MIRVLILDDDATMRALLARSVAPLIASEGVVREAETFDEGMAIISGWLPDLVLVDLRLRLQGAERTAHRMQELRDAAPGAVVLAISGVATEDVIRLALERGADGFMAKGDAFTQRRLWDAIDEASRKHGPGAVLDRLTEFVHRREEEKPKAGVK